MREATPDAAGGGTPGQVDDAIAARHGVSGGNVAASADAAGQSRRTAYVLRARTADNVAISYTGYAWSQRFAAAAEYSAEVAELRREQAAHVFDLSVESVRVGSPDDPPR
jgi:hypothetical protein